ncbi:hypothetical protein GCM10023091_26700 [Ravibacter arvi]|uniref:Alpha/beta hydrolase n=1 Tax=Ravibacter arvi TaxID=2051041 RepID=A0ABP8M0L8_9BACT
MALKLLTLVFLAFFCFSAKGQETREIYFKVPLNDCDTRHFPRGQNNAPVEDFAILKLPATYSANGEPTRLVYMAHGAGGGVSANEWFLNQFDLQRTLLENGYAVFDVNGGGVENFGGPLVVSSAFKAYQYIVQNFNVYPRIIVGGFSMGGLSSTNFVYRHSAIVLGHVMYSPVLDLYGQAWKNPWLKSTRQAMAAVYQFGNVSEFDSCAVNGFNPIDEYTVNSTRGPLKPYPVPVKIWHGARDPVVTVPTSRRFFEAVKRGGGDIELVEIDSDDHALSCGNESMNKELLLYIKRFK